MEKHKCKLCFRNFSNGRALGGHMRSHVMNLPIPPKSNESPPPPMVQLSFEAESSSPPSSEENKSLSYGLRENPKKNSRFVDPEFSFVEVGSVIVQDRESETEIETESSKNPTRKRSRTTRKFGTIKKSEKNESTSSASDTTTDEDVAFCLMMLSRDKWKKQQQQHHELMEESQEEQYYEEEEEQQQEEEEEEEEESDDESEELKPFKVNKRVRGRYKCDTCNKVFRSYQALGGHRASHKRIKVVEQHELEPENNNNVEDSVPLVVEKKIHQCPVCFRVFASGQALGGHKRTHVTGSAAAATTAAITEVRTPPKFGDNLIDLNLPPIDDDDVSQMEDSAVSDAEFVKSH